MDKIAGLKEKRRQRGISEKNQAKLYYEYRKKQRAEKRIVNYEDHWEEVDKKLLSWINNPKISKKGKESLFFIWKKVLSIVLELQEKELSPNVDLLKAINYIKILELSVKSATKTYKEYRQKYQETKVEVLNTNKTIKELRNIIKVKEKEIEYYENEQQGFGLELASKKRRVSLPRTQPKKRHMAHGGRRKWKKGEDLRKTNREGEYVKRERIRRTSKKVNEIFKDKIIKQK